MVWIHQILFRVSYRAMTFYVLNYLMIHMLSDSTDYRTSFNIMVQVYPSTVSQLVVNA